MHAITHELIKKIIFDQKEEQYRGDIYPRDVDALLLHQRENQEIIVITGVRRAGKSFALQTLRANNPESDYYFNFEDERLLSFTSDDFQTLYEVFIELFGEQQHFYFDEIQNIAGWEVFVRRLYNRGCKLWITGSNANLLSTELGTRLTGRYIKQEVFPFSFREIVRFEQPELLSQNAVSTKDSARLKQLFNNYFDVGGIPAYRQHRELEYLRTLYESILYKDIVVRYKLSNPNPLRNLVYYLASNCSKTMTYTSMKNAVDIKSLQTVTDYCSYLEDAYLCYFIQRFSPSLKIQERSPKKVYFVDHALAKQLGFHFSEDRGRLLENIVFLELRRRHRSIYYYSEQGECDFIIQEGSRVTQAIQVCLSLNHEKTLDREIKGLVEAMQTFNLSCGLILTEYESFEKTIEHEGKQYSIKAIPTMRWLLDV